MICPIKTCRAHLERLSEKERPEYFSICKHSIYHTFCEKGGCMGVKCINDEFEHRMKEAIRNE